MPHKYNPIFDLLGKERKLNLDTSSTAKDVVHVLGEPEHGWAPDGGLATYGDLEVGILMDVDEHNKFVSYYRLSLGDEDGENFIIPGVIHKKFKKKTFLLTNFVKFFLNRSIEFRYDKELDYKLEQRCLVTELDDKLFFMANKNGEYKLDKVFCKKI